MRIWSARRQTGYVWRNIQLVKSRIMLFFMLFLFSISLFALNFYLYSSIGLILTPIAYVLGVYTYRSYLIWKSGSKGEKMVSDTLTELDDRYLLVNGVVIPSNRGDIDHVVVGPNGIFVIESKNYGGAVLCNGDHWKKIRYKGNEQSEVLIGSPSNQVKRNAKVLKDYLLENKRQIFGRKSPHIWVHAVLVFTNPNATIEVRNPTVDIVRLEDLRTHIEAKGNKNFLSDATVDKIGEILSTKS